MDTINILSIITIAFLGSFGHCIGMCGGIVIAYSSSKINKNCSKINQSISHILYSLGRVTTYGLLGAIFGYLGGVISFSNTTNGIIWILLGIIMILMGLSLLGYIKFLTSIEHSLTTSIWYQNSFKNLINRQDLFSFYMLGMLNGLLPCGFVYFFAITASSTASALWGAFVMIIFGLSTIPALFSLGFFVSLFNQTKFRNIMIKTASIFVLLYGIWTIYNGYDYITNPKRTVLQCHIN